MRVYTVHLRRQGLDPDRDVVLVREGFSWGAAMFGFLWALRHRMGWTALGLLVSVAGATMAADLTLPAGPGRAVIVLAACLMIGFIGNDLRRRHLAADGFHEAGLVAAPDADTALLRYLDADPVLARDLASARA